MNETTTSKEKECKYCKSQMKTDATVCSTCHRNQKPIKDIVYPPNFIIIISLIISLGLLVLAYMQFYEAKKEREEASTALNQALIAKEEVERTALDLRKTLKLVVENSFIQAQSGIGLIMGADPEAKKRLEKNLNELSKFVEPDSLSNKKWWQNINKLYPQYKPD